MDTTGITHISFDCYGTIIDWEAGILNCLRRLCPAVDERELLESYARFEARFEAGAYRPYREILGLVEAEILEGVGRARPRQPAALASSLATWPPFTDSVAALQRLGERFRLVVISNVDRDLFDGTLEMLPGVTFDEIVTASSVGAYKPSVRNFEAALERCGIGPESLLHVAQSVYHDHVPAAAMGIRSIRVVRPSLLGEKGVTPEATAAVAASVRDLASIVDLVGC